MNLVYLLEMDVPFKVEGGFKERFFCFGNSKVEEGGGCDLGLHGLLLAGLLLAGLLLVRVIGGDECRLGQIWS